jgi:4-amino-4-deoxy-L-arabinose transferase-like glycosyltransferase
MYSDTLPLPKPVRSVRVALCVLCAFVVSFLLFFHRLADRDLWSSHEARAGMDAQTLLDEGALGLPRLYDGRAELQKPPLYYWLVAALGRLRGGTVDAWAVRLPAALSALLCVVALGLLGAAWGRGRPGRGAGVGGGPPLPSTRRGRPGPK